MSKRIASITASVTLSLLASIVALTVTPTAEAQCRPGSWLCAQVQVGVGVGVGGSVYIGPALPPPPPPQVVYIQPQQPQPPVVIYQPQPQPQVVYVQPQPQVVYVQQQRQQVSLQPLPPVQLREPRWGVHGEIGAMVSGNTAMGGGSVAIRMRPSPWFAVDLGIGAYSGIDYEGNDRVEIPLTANALFFVNPQSRLQLYFLAGVGLSYAHASNFAFDSSGFSGDFFGRDFSYVGGQIGIGLEWRLGRHFALNTDLRGFIRTRTDDDSRPEFVDPATGATTDTSGGVYWTGGATIYW